MPIFYLEPKEGVTSDPRWAATSLREGCWIDASTESDARQAVGIYTTRAAHPGPGQKTLISPWHDPALTHCRPGNSVGHVLDRIILTVNGRIIAHQRAR
jgi:hypothetical protein